MATRPRRRSVQVIMAAPIAEDMEWPEGKEKSLGTSIKRRTEGSSQQGLGRWTRFLMTRLLRNWPAKRARRRRTACFRCFLCTMRRRAERIQKNPMLPKRVTKTMKESMGGEVSVFCIQ